MLLHRGLCWVSFCWAARASARAIATGGQLPAGGTPFDAPVRLAHLDPLTPKLANQEKPLA